MIDSASFASETITPRITANMEHINAGSCFLILGFINGGPPAVFYRNRNQPRSLGWQRQ